MLKRLLIVFCSAIFLTTTVFLFAFRLRFIEPPASALLQKSLGIPVRIGRIDYRLFNRVTFTDLALGTTLRCRNATVYFNPWALIFSHDKLNAIINIDLEYPDLYAGQELEKLIKQVSPSGKTSLPAHFTLSWKNGALRMNGVVASDTSGRVVFGENTSASLKMNIAGRAVAVSLYRDSSNLIKAAADVSSPKEHAKLRLSLRNINGTISGAYSLPEFVWYGYHIDNASGTFAQSENNFSATFAHPALFGNLDGISVSSFTLRAHADFSGIIPQAGGTTEILINKAGGKIVGKITASAMRWHSYLITSSATVKFNNNVQTGAWYAESSIEPEQLLTKCFISPDGAFKTSFKGPNNATGDAYGVFSSSGANVSFNIPICIHGKPIVGNLSGTASYSTETKSGEARMSIKHFQYNSFSASEIRLTGSLDERAFNLKEFAIFCKSGTLIATGLIGRNHASPESNVSITARNFPIANGPIVSGNLNFAGSINTDNTIFSGALTGNDISINDLSSLSLTSQFSCSKSKLAIENINLSPYAKANGIINFSSAGTITASAALSKFPIRHIISGMKGFINAEAVISGTLTNPIVAIQALSPVLTYNSITFSANCRAHVREKRIFLDTISVKSQNGNAQFSGQITPELKLIGKTDNMDIRAIAPLIGGFPDYMNGTFSASLSAKGAISEPAVSVFLKAGNISFNNKRIAYVEGDANYRAGIINVSTVSVHIADSEFLVTNSTIDFKKNSYDVTTVLRNLHSGPFDFFGRARWMGAWKTDNNGKPSVTAAVQLKDMWINQCSLTAAKISLHYSNGLLTFVPLRSQALNFSGAIYVGFMPQVLFKKFVISHQQLTQTFSVNGETGPGKWDFTVKAHRVPADVLGELLNYPDLLEGDVDAAITASGSMSSPQIKGSVNLVNGSVAAVPCDMLAVDVSVLHDIATITRARWVKEGLYTVVANGYMPFALTSEAYKRVRRNPMDITISVEEGSLGFLTSISNDIKSARGSLHSQLRLAGTFQKPVANGYVKIANGEIESKKYISKVRELNANCIWRNNLLTFGNCRALIGKGSLSLSGSIKFDGIDPSLYDLSIKTGEGRGIPLSVPDLPIPSPLIKTGITSSLSRGEPQILVKLSGHASAPVLSGYAQLDNTNFTFPSLTPKSDNEGVFYSLIERLRWDLELRSGKNTWYENELVHVNIQGALHLSGIGRHPDIDGRIDAIRGNITYLGTEFTIKHATLEINDNNAVLDGQAEAELSNTQTNVPDIIDVDVNRAPIEKIVPRFSSPNNPGLTQDKALAIVSGADPERMSNTDQQYYVRQQFIRLFDSTLATPIAKNILRRSGLADTFHVSYQPKANLIAATPGTPTLSELMVGTKYSMEKYLTDRVLVGYSVAFDQAQNKLDLRHELELSYRWAPNLYLKGIYDLNSDETSQADRRVTVERQWRFGFGSGSKSKAKNKDSGK